MNNHPDSTPTPRPTPNFPLSPDDARIAARCDEYDDYAACLALAAAHREPAPLPTPF